MTHNQQLLVRNDPLLQVSLLLKTKSISVIVYTPLVIGASASEQTAPAAKKQRSVQGKFTSKIEALFYTKYSNELLLTHRQQHVLVCGVF